jgi:histidyl-tRNA synthetase
VSVVFVNDEMKKIAISIASKLRTRGINVDVELYGKPLRKQMELASESKYSIIVAPKEYANKMLIIRNMSDGSERQIEIESLLNNPQTSLQF